MKGVTAAIFLVAAMFPAGASAEKVFFGSMTWTAAQNCRNSNLDDPFTSHFHPRLPGNDDFTGLTHLNPFGGSGYDLEAKDFTSSFQAVSGYGVGWSGYTFENAAIRITEQNPPTIDSTTKTLTLRGQIRNPRGEPGAGSQPCIVTFKAAYVARTE